MILKLLAVSLNEQALTRPITARFDANGGTIGRADHSTMALPDPERYISRKQAEVVFMGDVYMIRNVGAANPIVVGSRTLGSGETAPLADGEEVRIGGYLLRVEARADTAALSEATLTELTELPSQAPPAPIAPPPRAAAPLPAAPLAAGANPFAELLGPATPAPAEDPFADLLGPAAPAVAPRLRPSSPASAPPAIAAPPSDPFGGLIPPAAGLHPHSPAVQAPSAPPTARIPDDFDPFRPASPQSPPPPAAAGGSDPFAEFNPVDRAPSIDIAFDLGVAGPDDPLARFTAGLGSGALPGARPLTTDPLELFGAPAPARATPPPAMPQADDLPAIHAAFVPPVRTLPAAPPPVERVAAAPPAPEPAAATELLRPRPASDDPDPALWQAFCAGAGIQSALPAAVAADRMRLLGRIVRSAVEGTLQLMAVRSSTKHEMRAAVTQIQARSNNPLKFSPDATTGIEQLVQPPARGFLDGPAAMEDAMQDLVGHSIGTVQGMRAALEGMLDRFDPAELEAKLGSGSMLDTLLPMNRKARLWELYLQHYRTLRDEAQDDFHALFGKAFVAAYEQQVARLKQRKRP